MNCGRQVKSPEPCPPAALRARRDAGTTVSPGARREAAFVDPRMTASSGAGRCNADSQRHGTARDAQLRKALRDLIQGARTWTSAAGSPRRSWCSGARRSGSQLQRRAVELVVGGVRRTEVLAGAAELERPEAQVPHRVAELLAAHGVRFSRRIPMDGLIDESTPPSRPTSTTTTLKSAACDACTTRSRLFMPDTTAYF